MKRTSFLSAGLQPDVDYSRWVCIYPAYIDKAKSLAKGRRIPKEKAVGNPSAPEVFGVVKALGIDCILEADKSYSRDCWMVGRIRARIFDGNHKPVNQNIQNRRELLTKVAAGIPQFREKSGQKAVKIGSSSKKSGKSKSKKNRK